MITVVWFAVTALILAWIWFAAMREAHRIYVFDRSVGAVTVYVWQVLVTLFWTVLLIMTSCGLFAVWLLDF